MITPPPYHAPRPHSLDLAATVCRKLRLQGNDRAFYMTIFCHVRDAEMDGHDTYPLWRQYCGDRSADLAVSAYLTAIASTRRQRGVR